MTDTRFKDIQKSALHLTPGQTPPIAPGKSAVYEKLDGLWCGDNPEKGLFQKNRFVHPVVGFTMDFPPDWKNQNTAQYVISAHPKKEAMLLLAVANKTSDPEEAGQDFIRQMRAKARIEPVTMTKTSSGEFPAYVVSYLDRSGGKPVFLYFAWVTMAGTTYELTGLAPEKYKDTLKTAALSLRPLTDTERKAINGNRLRMVAARDGERLEGLGTRTGNAWTPSYTALVNGLSDDTVLTAEQPIKIAHPEPCRP
jgi:predicted Zn-dependent protease